MNISEQLKSITAIREQLNKALPNLMEMTDKLKNNEIPQEKKNITINGHNIFATTHVGGLVTLHFATEQDKEEYFKTL